MEKSPKKLAGITVAVVALLVSGTAVYFDYKHAIDASVEFGKQILIDGEQNRQYAELVETQKQQYEALREQSRQLEELVKTQKEHHDRLKEQFDKTYQPLTRHEKIYDYISLLYDRIVLYRDWVSYLQGERREVADAYYAKAATKFHNAEKALRAGEFDLAQQLVEDTYAIMSKGYEAVASSNTTTNVP